MIARSSSILRDALRLLSVRLVMEQIGLALLVFLLAVLWLRLPDANVFELIASLVLGFIVLAVATGGESWIVLRLSGNERSPKTLLRGALSCLAGGALALAWSTLLDHLHRNDALRAGYFNSRFPHALRNFFSFPHIVLWLGWIWAALLWVGVGLIAALAVAAITSTRPAHAAVRALRSGTYWIALLVGAFAATTITSALMRWTPGHGLGAEMFSLASRLAVAVLLDAVVLSLLLTILTACVREPAEPYIALEGTPDESQPRTVDEP